MKRMLLCLFCIFIILSCGIVVAHENNTTDIGPDDALQSSDDAVLGDDAQVCATKSGIRNITFSDGYNGYCINLSKDHAEEGSVFTPKDTSHAMNSKYNTQIGNYLKILFVDFYETASTDSDAASEVIWDFSDRYYLDSNNPITQAILKLADEGRVIPDHGQTKQIDDKTEAIFDFQVFDPLNDDMQNYFGYKITLNEIKNDTSKSNDTDTANETETNSTNQTESNSTNSTEFGVKYINQTFTASDEGSEIGDAIYEEADDSSSISHEISNATGNPIVLLLMVLSILGFERFFRKD